MVPGNSNGSIVKRMVKWTAGLVCALAAFLVPQAVAEGGLDDLVEDTLILNLGEIDSVPAAMRADAVAQAAGAEYGAIPGAAHFSFLPECSALGGLVIALAGDDNICWDRGLRDRQAVHGDIVQAIGGFLERVRLTKG